MRTVLLCTLLVAACAPAVAPDAEPQAVAGVQAVLDPAADQDDPAHFFDLPLPSDLRLDLSGHPRLRGHPRPSDHVPTDQLLLLLDDAVGWSQVPVVLFRFDAAVAAAEPDDPPRTERDDDLLLVLVDRDAPDRGRLVPVVAQTLAEDPYTPPHVLALQPRPGFVLDAGRTWAAVVFRAHGDADGAPLGVPESLARLLHGQATAGPRGEEARRLYAPLVETLELLGRDPDDVAAATVFTTGDEVARTAALGDTVLHRFEPSIQGLALDPDDGGDHPRFCELVGRIELPQFQAGTPPFDAEGRFVWDAAGLVVQRTDTAPVALSIPRAAMPPDGWPVTVFVHGSSGDAAQVIDRGPATEPGGEPTPGLGPAHVLAARGIAAVGMGMLLGPDRLQPPRSRGYLNLLNLAAYRDTWRQAILETRLLLHALERLRVPPEALAGCEGVELPPGASAHSFDLRQGLLMGQSAGAHAVTMAGATDARVTAVVPTGSGGYWSKLLAEGAPRGVPPAVIAGALGTEVELTTLHPGLALLQHAWEASEPLVYAQRLAEQPLPGHPHRHLYVPFGQADTYFPEPLFDAMAVAYGLDLAGPVVWETMSDALSLAGHAPLASLPAAANRRREGATWTAVGVQAQGDGLADPHSIFAQLDPIKHQYACFLRTLVDAGTPTVVSPQDDDAAPCGP